MMIVFMNFFFFILIFFIGTCTHGLVSLEPTASPSPCFYKGEVPVELGKLALLTNISIAECYLP